MRKIAARPATTRALGTLGPACLALFMAQAPARAGGDISNFNVKNCASERIFVCSFDKTDSLMKIPYKARGIQPGDKKEFGCASIGRCKVIIGVSKRKSKNTLSSGMKAALATGAVGAAGIAGASAATAGAVTSGTTVTTTFIGAASLETGAFVFGSSTAAALTATAVAGGFVAVAAGGAVATLEITDGWSDGEVCNQVRKAAQKAGLKPKDSLQDGKTYTVIPQYATDKDGSPYLNPDGTAVLAYVAKKGNTCPAPLKMQLVPN